VRTGSNPDQILVAINVKDQTDIIELWNAKDNYEIEAYELHEDYKIIWDQQGDPYIITQDGVIIANERVKSKTYQIQDFTELNEVDRLTVLPLQKGSKFDGDNHNWFLLNEFLSLSFSYMTFVIMDKIEKEDEL